MEIQKTKTTFPLPSDSIVWTEFIQLTGTNEQRLQELLDMGWLDPVRTAEDALLFCQNDVYRMRRLERLCKDFDLHALGASIVMDLLDRIDELENRLRAVTNTR